MRSLPRQCAWVVRLADETAFHRTCTLSREVVLVKTVSHRLEPSGERQAGARDRPDALLGNAFEAGVDGGHPGAQAGGPHHGPRQLALRRLPLYLHHAAHNLRPHPSWRFIPQNHKRGNLQRVHKLQSR